MRVEVQSEQSMNKERDLYEDDELTEVAASTAGFDDLEYKSPGVMVVEGETTSIPSLYRPLHRHVDRHEMTLELSPYYSKSYREQGENHRS